MNSSRPLVTLYKKKSSNKVQFDTDDGQEELSHLRSQRIQDVKGFYFIIDVTDAKSINEANEIYNLALETHPEGIICVVAAGNTEVDKDQWQVTEDEIKVQTF